MSPTATTFLFETANFLLLATALGWLFFKPVRQALADRRGQLEAEEREAAEKLAAAQKNQQELATARANLQAELNELRARELEAAQKQADELLARTRAAMEQEREAGRRQLARMSGMQRELLAQAAATVAAETVERLLRQINGPDVHAALIRSACQQLLDLPRETLGAVKVESAQPLSSEQRAALDKALGPAAAHADYQAVGELGVGVRISTARGLIDASARGLAQFARHALIKEMSHRANNHNPLQIANNV